MKMIEKIKKRPLIQYYLLKICQQTEKDSEKELTVLPLKGIIGQLNAERRNLEKVGDEMVALHISSLAFLEEILKNMSEQSFRKLLTDLRKDDTFQ